MIGFTHEEMLSNQTLTDGDSVAIRVGSPPQWINVLPSTGSSETWVVGRAGCDSST